MPKAKNGPSPAIQRGADLILAIFENEKKELKAAHHKEIEESKARFANLKAKFMAERATESLSATHRVGSIDSERNQELENLRNSHERLKLSLEEMGFVYADGVIGFRDDVAQMVAQIIEDSAKINSGLRPNEPQNQPTSFVHFVVELLERNRSVVQNLESQLQALQEVQRENILDKVASFGEQIDSLKERIETPKLCPNCNAKIGLAKLGKPSGEGKNSIISKKSDLETAGSFTGKLNVHIPVPLGLLPSSPSKLASPGLAKSPTSYLGFPHEHSPGNTPGEQIPCEIRASRQAYEEISIRPPKRAASPISTREIPTKVQKFNEPNS